MSDNILEFKRPATKEPLEQRQCTSFVEREAQRIIEMKASDAEIKQAIDQLFLDVVKFFPETGLMIAEQRRLIEREICSFRSNP
jgi:hypothetical protein